MFGSRKRTLALVLGCLAVAGLSGAGIAALIQVEYKSGINWPEPKIIQPGTEPGSPPSDAVILFDGKDLSKWQGGQDWEVKDGYAISRRHDITTKDKFGDYQLHLEFATPEKVVGSSQGRGNSGVFLADRYEVQILDSYDNKTYYDGQCASIYKQVPPMVNVCRKPGEWQTYDILFEAPRFGEDGKVERPGIVTVLHNGVIVVNHFHLLGSTSYDRPPAYEKHPVEQPIHLQFHGNPVRFRNIWIRAMKPIEPKTKG